MKKTSMVMMMLLLPVLAMGGSLSEYMSTITNYSNLTTADYLDTFGNTRPTAEAPASVVTTVSDIYGFFAEVSFAGSAFDPADATTIPGAYVTNTYSITNRRNAADGDTDLWISAFTYSAAPPTKWDAVLWTNAAPAGWGAVTSCTDGGTTYGILAGEFGIEAAYTFRIRYWVPADTPNGTTGYVVLNVTNSAAALSGYGFYTGDNGVSYGGIGFTNDSGPAGANPGVGGYSYVIISAPVIRLSKSLYPAITTPASYQAIAGTSPTDPVPGATISYTIIYDNDGNSAATNLVVTDYVPANTTYVSNSMSLAGIHSNAGVIVRQVRTNFGVGGGWTTWQDSDMTITSVEAVRWVFSTNNVSAHSGSFNDTTALADGDEPNANEPLDIDTGWVRFEVTID